MGNFGTMKSRGREVTTRLHFVAVFMCLVVVAASASQGDDYLDAKERLLTQLAAAARENEAMKCDLLKTCTDATCSRNTCLYQKGDIDKYTCMSVGLNKYCKASTDAGPCQHKNFDYDKSFVRTAVNTDFRSVFTTIRTCSQRALDPVFQNISKPDSLLRVYFGSIDGSWRGFPGSDQDVKHPECGNVRYDTRLRPWYRASTSLPKVVAILIDAEQSMGTLLSPGLGQGTILENVKNIVGEFLKTLSAQDYINIIIFDGSNAIPLSPSMVQVIQNVSDVTASLPELNGLRQSLAQQQATDQPGTSNVTKAIDQALLGFGTNYPDAAKIILIFSDGKFATGNVSIPTVELASSNVKVFLYKIAQPTDGNLFLENSSFVNQLCSIGGTFEVISSYISNPLLALNSFFTFTATLHAAVTNHSADYSTIFPGYEAIYGNISTVSIPVFGADKKLLGVIGLDIFINLLGNITDLVYAAMQQRSLGEAFNTQKFPLTKADCSLQTALPLSNPCPAGVAIPPNGGFCPRTDMSSTIEDLACCKSCLIERPSGTKSSTKVIIGSTVGSFLAFILLSTSLLMFFRSHSRPRMIKDHKFQGQDPDPLDILTKAGMDKDYRISHT